MIRRFSLHARLLFVAAVTGIGALTFAFFAISHVFEGFVLRGLDNKLDTQVAVLASALGPDGRLQPARIVQLPDFNSPDWGWRVRGPAGEWSGGSGVAEEQVRRGHGHRTRGGFGHGRDGRPLYVRRIDVDTASGAVEIAAAAPRRIIDAPLRDALIPLLISLGLLALGLGLASLIQLRYGLRPVRALREALWRVRNGETHEVPTDQPAELRPLAEEVNALIAQNHAGLEHARRHVANLAHGLKTPLATLSLKLERDGAPSDSRALVVELDQRIAHHLRRARAGAVASGHRARTTVSEVAGDLIDAVSRVHASRRVAFTSQVEPALSIMVERQDLDELLGNLVDNAARHARSRVLVSARAASAMAAVVVEDDGPGMNNEEVMRAVRRGERLDEAGTGYGFGLGIVQELADLYGGSLTLRRSETLGGLAAEVLLPRSS